jgi:hypothetical protein
MHVNPKGEHDARGSDDLYSRANSLDVIASFFLCDAWRLGKDHRDSRAQLDES